MKVGYVRVSTADQPGRKKHSDSMVLNGFSRRRSQART